MGFKLKLKFGFDSNNKQIVNVANPVQLTDAINLQYFIENNSVDEYDPTTGYKSGTIVCYKYQLYRAEVNIPKPAGNFNYLFWNDISLYGKWINVSNTEPETVSALPGEMFLVNTEYNDSLIILPKDPVAGDYILVKDASGYAGVRTVTVKLETHIISNNEQTFALSIPYETAMFVYDVIQKRWNLHRTNANFISRVIGNNIITEPFQLQALDNIIDTRTDTNTPIYLKLPKNIHNKEFIKFTFKDYIKELVIEIGNLTHTIGTDKTTKETINNIKNFYLIFDKLTSNWQILDIIEYITYAEKVTINTHEISIIKNDSKKEQLTATISPNNVTNKDITWIGLDNEIVKISDTGVLTGVSNGVGWVTVITNNSKIDQCRIIVTTKVESIEIDEKVIVYIPKVVTGITMVPQAVLLPIDNTDYTLSIKEIDQLYIKKPVNKILLSDKKITIDIYVPVTKVELDKKLANFNINDYKLTTKLDNSTLYIKKPVTKISLATKAIEISLS